MSVYPFTYSPFSFCIPRHSQCLLIQICRLAFHHIPMHSSIYICRLTRRNAPNSVGVSPSKNYYPGAGAGVGGPPGGRKDILRTVPEMSSSGARVVDVSYPPVSPSSTLSSAVTSQGGAPRSGFSGGRNWPAMGASGARSMDALHHTPPQLKREAPPYRYVPSSVLGEP